MTHITRRRFLAAAGALSGAASGLLTACGGGGSELRNAYRMTPLVASRPGYGALRVQPGFVNAWGIAIRPAGAGGHFWVPAGGVSWEFVGDVHNSGDVSLRTLSVDGLAAVTVPGADERVDEQSIGKATGTVFNGATLDSDRFVVHGQPVVDANGSTVLLDGSARFIFATDSGVLSAWTERRADNGAILRRDGPALTVFDGSADGMAFFGLAIKPDSWDRLWAADFGATPQIRSFDKDWQLIATEGFANPFATGPLADAARPAQGKQPLPGDPVPFNIQVLGDRVFVAYCISQPDPADATAFHAAEEDALDAAAEAASGYRPAKGKLVEYSLAGDMLRIFEDDGRLNAPWGVAIAPQGFGALSNALLVGNFGGAGLICAYDRETGRFIDHLRDAGGARIAIPGLWGLQFGNGASLGDSDALYFAAGPQDETDGLFGALRVSE